MSRIVRDKFEVEMGKTESKIEYLKELWNFISGTPESSRIAKAKLMFPTHESNVSVNSKRDHPPPGQPPGI